MKGIIIGLLLVGGAAQAGQQLQLKSGTLDTNLNISTQVFQAAENKSSYRIIQFKNPITLENQNWLKSLGVEVLRYIPEDAYVARINNRSALSQLKDSAQIQTVIPYKAEFRLNEKALALSVFNESSPELLHIRAFKGANIEESLLKIRGLKIFEKENGAYIVELPLGKARELAAVEGIEWVDLYRAPELQKSPIGVDGELLTASAADGDINDLTGFETGTRVMNFNAAWRKGLTGKDQLVAVADTGLDTGDAVSLNRDFAGLKRPYIGGINSKSWGDPNGHGTHVTGSVLNNGYSSKGKIKGGAYQAGLILISVYSERYKNITIGPDPSPLFKVAYRDGARIHTNSWGAMSDFGAYNDSARAVDEFMFENPDMLILFSAGNDGVDRNQDGRIDEGSITSPSTAKNCLTVGASENKVLEGGVQIPLGMAGSVEEGFRWPAEPIASDTLSDNPNGLAAFSSRGPTEDGRLKPDVVAPGTNILSNCSQFPDAGKLWGEFNKDYCFSGGTSMSAPLVAAAATLVRQNLLKLGYKKPSAALIKAILMHSAVDMYPGQYGLVGKANGQELLAPGPNVNQGYGRVDVSRAISNDLKLKDEQVGLATGEEKRFKIPAGTRKVTLVYTDAPGSTAAKKALVNNLDLEVHNSSGSFFSSNSKLNNVEQINIPSGSNATELVVKATNVPMGKSGKQPYSLVYSR